MNTPANSNNEHMRQLLEAVASGLYTHQSGVRVAWSPDKVSAYTDGKTVFLPVPSKEMTAGDWRVLQGYIDHEVGHVQHSDFTSAITSAGKSLKRVTNIFEDARINRLVTAKWVGSKVNLGALYDRCAQTLDANEQAKAASAASPVAQRLNALSFALTGFTPKSWAFSPDEKAWARKWADELHRSLSSGTATTGDMQDIAARCLADLKQEIEQPAPPPPPAQAEQGGDTDDTCSGKSDGTGSGKGEGEGEGEGEGDGKGSGKPKPKPESESEAKPESKSDESESGESELDDAESSGSGEGESCGAGVHAHGEGEVTDSTSGASGASDSGCKSSEATIDDGIDAVTDGVEEALSGATGAEVDEMEKGETSDAHRWVNYVPVGEMEIDCHTGATRHPKMARGYENEAYAKGQWRQCWSHNKSTQEKLESSRGKAGSLAAHLERVLKARAVGATLLRQEEGERLDRSSFASIATNTHGGRVWEQDVRGDVKSTCVGIYIDGSGSMDERIPLGEGNLTVSKCSAAGLAARILVEALERCSVATEVGIWDTGNFHWNGGQGPTPNSIPLGIRTVVAKRFDRPFRGAEVARVSQPFTDGGTPLALSAAIMPARLAKRSETRKIAIILTDGSVGGTEAAEFDKNCLLAKRAGVEVVLVGVGTSLANVRHKHKVSALHANKLPEALAACLPSLLLATRNEARK